MSVRPNSMRMSSITCLKSSKVWNTSMRWTSQFANKFDAEYLNKNKANFTQLSPVSQLKKTVHQYPNVECYVHGDISRSWMEVDQRIKRFASAMARFGIAKNDVVSIMAPNSPAIFEAHFAIPSTGAVLHSLNTRSDARTIAYQLNHAETKILFVDTEYSDVVQSALELMDNPDKIIIVQIHDDIKYPISDSYKAGNTAMEYEEVLNLGSPTAPLNLPDDEWDAISLNYTSGTTGNPKGVVSHHRGAYLNSLANMVEWNMPLHPRFLWIVPMFHCNGWCFPWTMAASAGTSYFLRQIRAEPLFDIINRYNIQYFAGAPVTMNTMLAHKQKIKFTHSVQMWAAGAPPPTSVIKRFFDEIGIKVQCAYGLTETYGPICTHNVDRDWVDDPVSKLGWRPLSDEELLLKSTYLSCDTTVEDLKILDPVTMVEVPADGLTIGEVMVRGNVVMKGYLGNEKATREAFEGGWFHTGDLAVHHGNGRVEIKDRSKDIIISGGENISSIEVEGLLLTHHLIDEAAVIAIPDERWGEVPCAFVTLRNDVAPSQGTGGNSEMWKTALSADMIAWARTKMAGYQTPKVLCIVDALPKTSTGKVQKAVLRENWKELEAK